MKNRINYYSVAKEALKNMMTMENYLGTTTLDKKLMELVKIRVSQINGCAFCINMHTAETRKNGETEQRIYLLNAWKETTLYTPAERAALHFAETLTIISSNDISDALFEATRQYFDEKEFTDLVILINQINSWNRLSISMANPV